MTRRQWEAIERSLDGLTVPDRLELVEHIVQTIRAEATATPDQTRQQRDDLNRLRERLAALPVADNADGLTNRDHDRILYGAGA